MLLPLTVSCFSKIQIGFTFLVPAHLGSPGKRAVKWCVCVCVSVVGFCFLITVNLQDRNAETTCLSSLYPGDPLSFKNVAIVTLLSQPLLLIQ